MGIELLKRLREADASDFPDFYVYERPLERGLWILWVAKDKLGIKRLMAEQIASAIREVRRLASMQDRLLNLSTEREIRYVLIDRTTQLTTK